MKFLTITALLALCAGNAFATKTRLLALGEDKDGSYYIDDNRNIFINPAEVNNFKDFITLEYGDDLTRTTIEGDRDDRAEGGFVMRASHLNYGVHFGAENDTANYFRGLVSPNLQGDDNKFDFFIGGDAGVKWGASIGFSQSKNEVTAAKDESSALFTRLGMIKNDFELFSTIAISNSAEYQATAAGAKQEFDGKLGLVVGAKKAISDYKVYVIGAYFDYDYENGSGTVTPPNGLLVGSGEFNLYRVRAGAGRTKNITEKAKIFTNLEFVYEKAKAEFTVATIDGEDETKIYYLPAVVGMEYKALSWLDLRGSVSQNIYSNGERNDNKYIVSDTTMVNFGSSFVFDTLTVDTLVGQAEKVGAATRSTETIYKMAMTYNF